MTGCKSIRHRVSHAGPLGFSFLPGLQRITRMGTSLWVSGPALRKYAGRAGYLGGNTIVCHWLSGRYHLYLRLALR